MGYFSERVEAEAKIIRQLQHQLESKMTETKKPTKLSLEDKINNWTMIYEFIEGRVQVIRKPAISGWYASKQMVNPKILRSKCLPSYWDGKIWKNGPNEKEENTKVYAFICTYCDHKEAAEETCEKFDVE